MFFYKKGVAPFMPVLARDISHPQENGAS